jgi:citrate lyase subunit beta/citryl-CoA lyase
MARLEAAIRELGPVENEYLPEIVTACMYETERERFRFSRLYLPGNTPKMMINAGVHNPHGIILDLEDSVAPAKKSEARLLVRNALRTVNFYGAEKMVRINQLPLGLEDLPFVVPHGVHLILLPKCEGASEVRNLDKEIRVIQKERGIKNRVYIMPIIESALGIENAFEIASASENIVGLAIGLEDYTADLGVRRTTGAEESLYARTRLVNACKAAGILAIDSVFSDVADMDALRTTVRKSRALGFEGMGCIHPRQIAVIHESYEPEEKEIIGAKKIVDAYYQAEEMGLGVVSIGTKMIDPPVVKRAERIIRLAVDLKIIDKNWRDTYEG